MSPLEILMRGTEPFERLRGKFEELEAGRSVALGREATPPSDFKGPGPWIGIESSGSTGPQRLVWWLWRDFKGSIPTSSSRKGWVWATGFRPDSYGGAQVAVQAWLEQGRVLFLERSSTEAWRRIERNSVDALSVTPTFADLLAACDSRAGPWSPRQLTLGGEVLRPLVGERIRARFTEARILVVYASSELGIMFKTRRLDGIYEGTGLDKRFQGWRVDSAGAMASGSRGNLELLLNEVWRRTGDIAEIVQGSRGEALIRLVGRNDAIANVAGMKVNLDSVISAAENVRGVTRALAWAEPNGVAGEIVALKIQMDPGFEWGELKQRVEFSLQRAMPKPAWPRVWEEGEIGLGRNGKREAGGRHATRCLKV